MYIDMVFAKVVLRGVIVESSWLNEARFESSLLVVIQIIFHAFIESETNMVGQPVNSITLTLLIKTLRVLLLERSNP